MVCDDVCNRIGQGNVPGLFGTGRGIWWWYWWCHLAKRPSRPQDAFDHFTAVPPDMRSKGTKCSREMLPDKVLGSSAPQLKSFSPFPQSCFLLHYLKLIAQLQFFWRINAFPRKRSIHIRFLIQTGNEWNIFETAAIIVRNFIPHEKKKTVM